ncbi:chloride channel protein [Lactobacillus selangorensis]|uniref:chloride channel protein n=1 Tax=Lactobacillus selangorensis TaxID=81857 RepID=UPI00070B3838|nr:chloride channel protein [Lactobacillus selangorensis]
MKDYLKDLLYSVCLGALASLLIVGFTAIVAFLTNVIWTDFPQRLNQPAYWPLVIGLVGGLIVGSLQKWVGPYPFSMEKSLALAKTGSPDSYKHRVWRNFLNAVVILALGAGVGPEAALISIVSELVVWISDRLKFTRTQFDFWENNSFGAVLALIFRSPFFGLSEQYTNEKKHRRSWHWDSIYVITIASAWFIFKSLHRFVSAPFLYIHSRASITYPKNTIRTVIIALVLAIAAYWLYAGLNRLVGKLSRWQSQPILLAVLGGLILGLTGMWTHFLLFSGETSIYALLKVFSNLSGWTLLIWGLLKMLLATFYNATGWRGGKIFPNIWGSLCMGLGAANLLGLSPRLLATVFCTAILTEIMPKPLVVCGLLVLLFPIQLLPLIIVVSVATVWIQKGLNKGFKHLTA